MITREALCEVLLIGFAMLGTSGCEDLQNPASPRITANLTEESLNQPFYYNYRDEKVGLVEDAGAIVVRGTSPVAEANETLAGLGVSIRNSDALPDGHYLLHLNGVSDHVKLHAVVDRLRSSGHFRFVSSAFRTKEGNHPILLLDHLDVRFKDGVSTTQIDSLIRAMRLRVIRPPRPDSGFYAYRLGYPDDLSDDPLQLVATLHGHDLVKWADADRASDWLPSTVPSDPYFSLQFNLKNTNLGPFGVPVDINVEPAWDLTTGSKSIRVVILDDGVDWLHQDLLSVLGGGMGYDLAAQFKQPGAQDNAYSPFCNDGHGTSIAGIIGAAHNGVGTAGIAPGVTLTVVRIARGTYNCPQGNDPHIVGSAQLADAINWAWQYAQADVISISYGGWDQSINVGQAISNAVTNGRGGKGTVVVVAAGNTADRAFGNTGEVEYPASISSVIAVGAIDRYGQPANYTPDGPIALVAPSSAHVTYSCGTGEVVTTDRWSSPGCNDGPSGDQNYTTTFSGTSAAAPQVAAVAALLLSRYPSFTVGQVRSRLTSSADPWGASMTFGAGKLNAFAMLYTQATVQIIGPRTVGPTTSMCSSWGALVQGGEPPFEYSWSGLFSGLEQDITGSVPGSGGNLAVQVTDALGRLSSTSIHITYDPNDQGSCQ